MKSFSFGRGLSAAATLLILAGCASEAPWGTGSGEGSIRLRLTALNDVTAAVPAVRAVSTEIVTPPVKDFKVKVSKTDGSYSETFSNVEEFVNKHTFSVGSYEIESWYGDPEAQGLVEEGQEPYQHAYYNGKTTGITVVEGQTTEVSLNASLANSIIVIEYTEAFKNYFTDYSTTLQTGGNSPIKLGNAEGMCYVVSGDVNVTISAELQNGKQLSLSPASFKADACHMYKMRYNIYNGEVGGVDKLEIQFDESLEVEPVIIDLSADLENTPVPVVTPEGFEKGQRFVTQSGVPFDGEIKYNVSAAGSIKEALLTIVSDSYKPGFLKDGVIDLCSASDDDKAQMEAEGIKAVGFFRNPGQMAQLDLTGLCRNLPEGEHLFTFQVKDQYSQANEPVDVGVACHSVNMSMTAAPAPFGEGYADITISYDGPDPTAPGSNPFTFRAQNNSGYVDSEILSIKKMESTRAYESYDYVYRITVPDVDRDEFNVRAYFGKETAAGPTMEIKVPFEYPDYQVELDPMTKKLRINVVNDDPKKKTLFFHKLKVFINGNRLKEGEFSRDEPTGLIAVYDLEPSTQYRVQTTLQSAENATKFGSDDTFTTTEALPVPNGDFSETAETINKTLQVGGQYKVSPTTYTIKCNFRYSEPVGGWASVNKKSFYEGANPQNSWFMVASTYMDGNSVVIRTVGYNHNGTVPSTTGGVFNTTYYNDQAPTEESFARCSGELFLGLYDFNGSEVRQEGVAFAARPTSLEFSYKYEPKQTASRGSAELIIYAEDGVSVLNRRKIYLYKTETMTDTKIVLNRYPFGVKPGKVLIKFLSSDLEEGSRLELNIPTGKALDEGQNLGNKTLKENSAHAIATGSVLTVSNLRFNYGEKQ